MLLKNQGTEILLFTLFTSAMRWLGSISIDLISAIDFSILKLYSGLTHFHSSLIMVLILLSTGFAPYIKSSGIQCISCEPSLYVIKTSTGIGINPTRLIVMPALVPFT